MDTMSDDQFGYTPTDIYRMAILAVPKAQKDRIAVFAEMFCDPATKNISEIRAKANINSKTSNSILISIAKNHQDIYVKKKHLFPHNVKKLIDTGLTPEQHAQDTLSQADPASADLIEALRNCADPATLLTKAGMEESLATALAFAMKHGHLNNITPLASELNKVKGNHAPKVKVEWHLTTILPEGGVPSLQGECARVLGELKSLGLEGLDDAEFEDVAQPALPTGTGD